MTDELKEKLKSAQSAEELRKMVEDHRDELTEEDLELISGGAGCEWWPDTTDFEYDPQH